MNINSRWGPPLIFPQSRPLLLLLLHGPFTNELFMKLGFGHVSTIGFVISSVNWFETDSDGDVEVEKAKFARKAHRNSHWNAPFWTVLKIFEDWLQKPVALKVNRPLSKCWVAETSCSQSAPELPLECAVLGRSLTWLSQLVAETSCSESAPERPPEYTLLFFNLPETLVN